MGRRGSGALVVARLKWIDMGGVGCGSGALVVARLAWIGMGVVGHG